MGHALLNPLLQVGYVQKVGDLWTLRSVGTAVGTGEFPSATAVGTAVGLPVPPPLGLPEGLPVVPAHGPPWSPMDEIRPAGFDVWEPDPSARLRRLRMLVALATEPHASVTHDATLGDIAVRGWELDEWMTQACALAVLRGKSMNAYPHYGDEMIVALTPIEAARALFLQWRRGKPPELPNEEVWIFLDDGVATLPACPDGIIDEDDECNVPLPRRIHRQRRAAGLA